jgi:aminopeptidase YwaD
MDNRLVESFRAVMVGAGECAFDSPWVRWRPGPTPFAAELLKLLGASTVRAVGHRTLERHQRTSGGGAMTYEAIQEKGASARLAADLDRICDCGGRLSGSESEKSSTALLRKLGEEATGVAARVEPVPYLGWQCLKSELTIDGRPHACHPLVRSEATSDEGLEAEVLDLGRGTPEEFEAHRSEIAGRIVLVRHELMFSAGTIHRRLKYRMALEAGAAGFLIAGPVAGSPVTGSTGRQEERGIPALGVAPETARALARTASGRPRVRIRLETEQTPAIAENLIFDMAGGADGWVVLSAHIDGHDLAESAIDNASGLAAALEVARRLAPEIRRRRRGLRLAFFNIEEWALSGSAAHVAALSEPERGLVALNVNLDSVAGAAHLTALTSGFSRLEPFLLECAAAAGVPLSLYRPLQANSDHANFAQAGIPAFRLVAGFGDPRAATAEVLTANDRRSIIAAEDLQRAVSLAIDITSGALDAEPSEASVWRQRWPSPDRAGCSELCRSTVRRRFDEVWSLPSL